MLAYSLGYTWLDTEDLATGESLPLRAKDRVNLNIGYTGGRLSAGLDYIYMGSRFDPSIGKDLAPYNLVHLSGSFKLGSTFSLYGRVENVLDEEYSDLGGYSAPMREYYAGLRASF